MKASVFVLAALFAGVSVCQAGEADTQKKLKSIVLKQVEFKDTDLNAVVRYLSQESRRLDYSGGKGVNFIVRGNASKQKRINLELSNVPLSAVVHYVCLLGGLDYKIERNAVIIGPKGSLGGAMNRQTFRLPRNVLDALAKMEAAGKKKGADKKDDLGGVMDGSIFFEK